MTKTPLTKQQQALVTALTAAYQGPPLQMADWQNVVTDFDTGYAIQDAVTQARRQSVTGYKISLTSPETQALFGTSEPLYGQQIADHVISSTTPIALKTLNAPLMEVEIVFTAKTDLSPTMTTEELLNHCTINGGIEIPDARFTDWFPSLDKYLVVSDSAVGGYITSGTPIDGTTLTVADLANIHVALYHDNNLIREGDSKTVLGNPLQSLQWLVTKLAKQSKHITAGQTISAGTFFLPPTLTTGNYSAVFTGSITTKTTLIVTK